MNTSGQISTLLTKYKSIFKTTPPPDWAVENKKTGEKISPSIPFVGERYNQSKNKILLYASAENLTYYEEDNSPNDLLETEISWNRRRESIKLNSSTEFPDIHVSPVSNGGLLSALALLGESLNLFETNHDPFKFIENVSIDNFGKFSIKTKEISNNSNFF